MKFRFVITSIRFTLFALPLALILSRVVFGQTADTIYHNGSILTMTGKVPSYLEALAVKDGRIVIAGRKDDALKMKGDPTRVVDLGGKALRPGFLDAHNLPTRPCE
jgi:predicted amidohydrolase YtcJ